MLMTGMKSCLPRYFKILAMTLHQNLKITKNRRPFIYY